MVDLDAIKKAAENSQTAQSLRDELPARLLNGIPYYDRNGEIIDYATYCVLAGNEDYKRVDQTTLGHYWISTVWLGIDHDFAAPYGTPNRAPIIFETMVFADDDAPHKFYDIDARRYSTEQEARDGHAEFVTLIRTTNEVFPE